MHGTVTSQTEISNISTNGLWLLYGDREYFLPYDQFPWFKDAPIKHIFNLEEPHPGHLYWPDLDVISPLKSSNTQSDFPG
ncbi:MAG TPA: DUF2442 domain-containing protein [Nodosilinea sp.]|nr:DUF2442 domain-containing protein [Nodosilinea sp.]